MRIYYGWWIVVAAFLNLFFAVGIIFYGLPVFYPELVKDLGFSRSQVTEGILIGFLIIAPFVGYIGSQIDRRGARAVIRFGLLFVGVPLVLMGWMTQLWQYYLLSIAEVFGYILTGPIPNQVLIARWFRAARGRAMGYAYLGLGLGGAVSPVFIHFLIANYGWRRAFEVVGVLIMAVLLPIAQWVTRSDPSELGLVPDGVPQPESDRSEHEDVFDLRRVVRSTNFWLILLGSTLVIGAIGTVIQQFVLFLHDQKYTLGEASVISSGLLFAGLAGRVIVGYLADRFQKKNVMATFYLILALAIPLLFIARYRLAAWAFAIIFGFAMGADYMLIPLVTADCFGLATLGKLLAVIIMANSLGQWIGPWMAGLIFDATHSYNVAWTVVTIGGVVGAYLIYSINVSREKATARTVPAATA
ncbi:MAG TPA: MFS transporter [Terriglobia bacterium]|jgi:sugar phosphate permease|nr:MFS transporter [Terriglobia bacterium]